MAIQYHKEAIQDHKKAMPGHTRPQMAVKSDLVKHTRTTRLLLGPLTFARGKKI